IGVPSCADSKAPISMLTKSWLFDVPETPVWPELIADCWMRKHCVSSFGSQVCAEATDEMSNTTARKMNVCLRIKAPSACVDGLGESFPYELRVASCERVALPRTAHPATRNAPPSPPPPARSRRAC